MGDDSFSAISGFNKSLLMQAQYAQQQTKIDKATSAEKSSGSFEEAEAAATQFESLLIRQMIDAMWKTVPKEGLLSGSSEEEHYREMLHQGMADDMAKGDGIGIKEVIMRELAERGEFDPGKNS